MCAETFNPAVTTPDRSGGRRAELARDPSNPNRLYALVASTNSSIKEKVAGSASFELTTCPCAAVASGWAIASRREDFRDVCKRNTSSNPVPYEHNTEADSLLPYGIIP